MDLTQVYIKIQESLINNEKVKFPGVGEFEVVVQSAAFLQDGKTIAPPSKKLLFVQSDPKDECEQWMQELGEMIRESLVAKGEFGIPGFGVFADKGEGVIEFALNEEFDFAPDNFSLEAISLEEVHREELVVVEKEEEKVDQIEPVKQRVEEVVKKEMTDKVSDVEHKKDCRRKWMMGIVLVLVFIAVLVLFAVLFKEDLMQMLQNILYTDEELEIMKKWAAQ